MFYTVCIYASNFKKGIGIKSEKLRKQVWNQIREWKQVKDGA